MTLAGELLKRSRESVNLSIGQLCKRLTPSTTLQFCFQVEQGISKIPASRIAEWCEIIGLDMKELVKAMASDYELRVHELILIHKRMPTHQRSALEDQIGGDN